MSNAPAVVDNALVAVACNDFARFVSLIVGHGSAVLGWWQVAMLPARATNKVVAH